MEPTTVIEEVFKQIDERQVLLLLCLIDGATSVLLLSVLVHGMSYGVMDVIDFKCVSL